MSANKASGQALANGGSLDDVLAHAPALHARYKAFVESWWQDGTLSRRLLELVRLRIGLIHGQDLSDQKRDPEVALSAAEEQDLIAARFDNFPPQERVALEAAEHIPFDHHGLSDAQVHALSEHLGHRGAVALLIAAAFFDVNCRLNLVWAVPSTPGTYQPGQLA